MTHASKTLTVEKKNYSFSGIIFVFLTSFGFLMSMEFVIRMWMPEILSEGFYFQVWSSDELIQTLPISNLYNEPWESLWALHKQPPMLDMIRAFLAQLSSQDSNPGLLFNVDYMMYIVWGLFYALLSALIFAWIRELLGKGPATCLLTFLWVIHPGSLAMATLLDGTMLSSLLTTWLLYELWRMTTTAEATWRLTVAAILLYLTRTIFQWYFIPVLLLSLLVARVPLGRLVRILAPLFIVVALFSAKQWYLFGSVSTTTFDGEHKLGIIWYHPTPEELAQFPTPTLKNYPDINIEDRYNTQQQVKINQTYNSIFKKRLACCFKESLMGIFKSLNMNFKEFLLPTSGYHWNAIIDHLLSWPTFLVPWPMFYNLFISGWPIIILFFTALLAWIFNNRKRLNRECISGFAPWIPAGYCFAIIMLCNRYEWTEADRLKFILEPALFVWISSQIVLFWREFKTISKKSKPSGVPSSSFDYEQVDPGYYDHVYQRRRGIQSYWHHLKFKKAIEALDQCERHLDIGCGPGTFIGLLDGAAEAFGIDVSKKQIDYAKQRYGNNNKTFKHFNGVELPFNDNYFNSVSLLELIEHLPEERIQPLMSEVRRVLRPGGTVLLTTPNYSSAWPVLEWIVNRLGAVSYEEQHITHFNRHRLLKMLKQVGFQNVEVTGFQFIAFFAAAFGWRLADRVSQLEPRALTNRFGFLLLARGIN